MLFQILLLGGVVLLLLLLNRLRVAYQYFEKRGVPYVKPVYFLGSMGSVFFKFITTQDFAVQLYNSFPNEKFFGFYSFTKPIYFPRCPQFLKAITMKDADHFIDHMPLMDRETNDLFGNCMIFLRGDKWRDMRSTLSPAFTGSKMRLMFKLMAECSEQMSAHFAQRSKRGEQIGGDVKDMFSRCADDVIASCAFGVQVNSFKNPSNEFFTTGKKLMVPRYLPFILISFLPTPMKKLNVTIFDGWCSNYFRSLVLDTMETRDKQGIHRPDMINLLMQVRKGKYAQNNEERTDDDGFATVDESQTGKRLVQREWTDDELIAQCFIFFLAGFESTSNTMAAMAYEISINPSIQDCLYQEIKEAKSKLNGQPIDYDSLQKMKYLDQVVSETLRKWPVLPMTDRYCVKDYVYDDGETKVNIEKGAGVNVPIYAFHHDPKYFPNPHSFDPDRFSDENKKNIVSGTYMPFGIGPRSCIGSRFALMQVKLTICHLLAQFKLLPNKRSQIPIKLKKDLFQTSFEKGVDLDLQLREDID